MLRIRVNEGCAPPSTLLWDTVWNAAEGFGDWAVAGATETGNRGGLQATAALETSVIHCLFEDGYCPIGHPLEKNIQDGDRRGYWGYGVNDGSRERSRGSLLWLLENTAIDPVDTPRWLVSMSLDSLSVLIGQQAIVDVKAQAEADSTRNRADLAVQLYGRDGQKKYDRRFQFLWAQIGKG